MTSPCLECQHASRHILNPDEIACCHPDVPGLEGSGLKQEARARGAELSLSLGVQVGRAGAQHRPTWPTYYPPPRS